MSYTLHDYFVAAGLQQKVAFAEHIPMREDKLPMKHQISGLNKAIRADRFGLYDDPGCGKSLISHAWALYWASEGQKTIALLPPNLMYQYVEELKDIYKGVEKFFRVAIFDQGPAGRDKLRTQWGDNPPEMLCMSYQMFLKEWPWAISAGYRVLIADEAQALKSCESKIHKAVENFINQPGGAAFLPMTGTPLYNRPEDCYGLINLTAPDLYETYRVFESRHCVFKKIRFKVPKVVGKRKITGFRKLVGYKNLPQIRAALYKNGRRVIRDDVAEIQKPQVIEVAVKLDPAHLSLYKKLVRERFLEVNDEIVTALQHQALRMAALQIVSCPQKFVSDGVVIKNNVIETTKELMDSVDVTQTKVILFCNFRKTVETLNEALAHLNPALMYGDVDSEAGRQKFLHDDTCRVLVAHPKSAGAGFNFQGVCHTIIFVEPTSVPGEFKQASERVVRWGQSKKVNIYILKALGTVVPAATRDMLQKEGYVQQINRDRTSLLDDFIPA